MSHQSKTVCVHRCSDHTDSSSCIQTTVLIACSETTASASQCYGWVCLNCCADAVQALVGIHKERSHRDLKSGNVVVSGWDGRGALRVNLVDWASSRLHTEGEHMFFLQNIKMLP